MTAQKHSCAITHDQAVTLRVDGLSVREIADKYGVTTTTVYRMLKSPHEDAPQERPAKVARLSLGSRVGTRTVTAFVGSRKVWARCTCGHQELLRERSLAYSQTPGCSKCRHVRKYAEETLKVSTDTLNLMYSHKRFLLGALLEGETQQNVGDMVGISQPSVHYTINTTLQRCRYYGALDRPSFSEVRKFVRKHAPGSKSQRCLEEMFRHQGNQMAAAEVLGVSQGWVRHQYHKGLSDLPDHKVTRWLSLPLRIEPRWEERDAKWSENLPKKRPGGKELHRRAKRLFER